MYNDGYVEHPVWGQMVHSQSIEMKQKPKEFGSGQSQSPLYKWFEEVNLTSTRSTGSTWSFGGALHLPTDFSGSSPLDANFSSLASVVVGFFQAK